MKSTLIFLGILLLSCGMPQANSKTHNNNNNQPTSLDTLSNTDKSFLMIRDVVYTRFKENRNISEDATFQLYRVAKASEKAIWSWLSTYSNCIGREEDFKKMEDKASSSRDYYMVWSSIKNYDKFTKEEYEITLPFVFLDNSYRVAEISCDSGLFFNDKYIKILNTKVQ